MRMFDYVHSIEMRVLGPNGNAVTEATPLNEPLPNTDLINTIDFNGTPCLLSYYFALMQCGNLSEGQALLELCTDNPDFVSGISGSALDTASAVGTTIGFGVMGAGLATNACASRTQNPSLRMAGMATADTCLIAGQAITFSPVSTIVGAAAMGTTINTAMLTTSALSWLASVPLAAAEAVCLHYLCCKPTEDQIRPATTTRLLQYRAVSAVMGERNPPPPYNPHNGIN